MIHGGLTSKELAKLSVSAADLYRTTNRSQLAHRIASFADEALGGDHSISWEIDVNSLEQTSVYSNSDSEQMAHKSWPVWEHYAARYPIFNAQLNNPRHRGKVIRVTEILPHAKVRPTGFLDDYCRPSHCLYQLAYFFKQQGSHLALLSCNRNSRDYSDRELAILQFLAPHFQAAYENSGAFDALSQALARAREVQQTLPVESLWIDHQYKVCDATPGVFGLIREFLQVEFTSQQLPKALMDWLRKPDAPPSGRPPAPLVIRRDDACLKIRFYPQQRPGLHLLILSRQVLTPTLDHIKPLGLTPREAEILLWVAQAKTNDEIARLLGCSPRTVGKHMEHLLLKLKVENRAAAMLLVMDLLQPGG